MDGRTLATLAASNLRTSLYRIGQRLPDILTVLRDMSAPEWAIGEYARREGKRLRLEEIRAHFRRKRFGATGYGLPSRFSDSSFPVLYTAEQGETAYAEKEYHVQRWAERNGYTPVTEYYSEYSVQFEGRAKDLTSLDWPELTADDYTVCQRLGSEATAENLSGLRTPSARRRGGVCVPVFSAAALSEPEEIREVSISVGSSGS